MLPQLVIGDWELWAGAISTCAALGAAAALLHARRSAVVTRIGILKRFAMAGLVLSLAGPIAISAALGWREDGPEAALELAGHAVFLAPLLAIYAVPPASLAGLAAGWLLFVPAPLQAGGPVTTP
ncbi:hypothetical protein [Falsiroseomonas stagni]|uniref:Uncharacterized protein n=1 Tax=Falsiroseomonas stagni DSM 19981 TaxID=1123062 RepID=A0A1I4D6Q2_9PROT|nr:hypothetical protein [Falsiroseomonas stagni]SFK88077.1 hypothetical protein SAMN02745775_109144 [Falsiroseomonas stagni DSM 19981]